MEIHISKSRKRLEVWENGLLEIDFPIAVGRDESGHKEREGDLRTPEGEYRICVKNPKSKYHLSLGLNYPNDRDAQEGLHKGLITAEERDAILLANAESKIPLWKTILGGEVYIHGHLEKQNWSHGCIRMFDKDIETLFARTSVGTKVIISK